MRQITVGLVGCGRNAENHLRVYSSTPGVRLVAVCDLIEGNAERMARKFGAERVFSAPEPMLKLDLDLVDIVTPTPTHAPLTIRAVESGHNVLVEKPMSLSSRECAEMVSSARRSGRSLCVNHNKLFYKSVTETKRSIEEEGLSVSRAHVAHFFVYSSERPDWVLTEETGGVMWEAMVHHAYLLEHFLGPIDGVKSVARRVRGPVLDSISLLTESGGRAGLAEYERYARTPLLGFRVLTDEGVRFDGDLLGDFMLRWPPDRTHRLPRTLQGVLDDFAVPLRKQGRRFLSLTGPPQAAVSPYKTTFFVIIRRFLRFLAGEEAAAPVEPEAGLRAVEVLEAARNSIENGQYQRIRG